MIRIINLFFIIIYFSATNAYSLIEIDITRGNLDPLPIAVSPLFQDDGSKQNAIDEIKIENVGFPVREPMLSSGKVQAITGFSFSSYINLASKGVSEDDISLMLMADYGLKLYGNAVIVNTDFAKAKPNIVKTFLSTTIKGMKEMIADPASTIPYVLKYNKIAKAKTETTRLKMAIRDNIVTDAVKANGIGSVDMNRLNESIKQLSETYSFKTKMDGSKVFDDSYLPDSFKRKL